MRTERLARGDRAAVAAARFAAAWALGRAGRRLAAQAPRVRGPAAGALCASTEASDRAARALGMALAIAVAAVPLVGARAARADVARDAPPGRVELYRAGERIAGFDAIQPAVDAALPGDRVVIGPGRFHGSVVIHAKRGDRTRTIELAGARRGRTELTLADVRAEKTPNDVWSPAPDVGPRVFVARAPLYAPAFRADGRRLLQPRTKGLLTGTRRGDFVALASLDLDVMLREDDGAGGTRTLVHLRGGADPRRVPLHAPAEPGAIVAIHDSAHVRVRDLILRYGGAQGIDIRRSSHVQIEDVRVVGGRDGIRVKHGGAEDVTIRRCVVQNALDPRWFWRDVKNGPDEGSGIAISGPRSLVESSRIEGWFNGINAVCIPARGCDADGARGLVIRRNTIGHILDDAVELDGFQADARVYENHVFDAFIGISLDPRLVLSADDVSYVYRNRFVVTRAPPFERDASALARGEVGRPSFSKLHPAEIGPSPSELRGPRAMRFYHNTIVSRFDVIKGSPGAPHKAYPEDFVWLDNIFVSIEGPVVRRSGEAHAGNQIDGNLYHLATSARESRLIVDWNVPPGARRNAFRTLDEARSSPAGQASGWEEHGIEADPGLALDQISAPGRAPPRLILPATSPARDAAIALPPGLPDSLRIADGAADLGAVELGVPLALLAIEPPEGRAGGGEHRVIVGDGFDDETRVIIGGQEVEDVLYVSPTTLFVAAPPAPARADGRRAAGVTVEVARGAERAVLHAAYRYLTTPTPPEAAPRPEPAVSAPLRLGLHPAHRMAEDVPRWSELIGRSEGAFDGDASDALDARRRRRALASRDRGRRPSAVHPDLLPVRGHPPDRRRRVRGADPRGAPAARRARRRLRPDRAARRGDGADRLAPAARRVAARALLGARHVRRARRGDPHRADTRGAGLADLGVPQGTQHDRGGAADHSARRAGHCSARNHPAASMTPTSRRRACSRCERPPGGGPGPRA